MSRNTQMLSLAFAGLLSFGSFDVVHAAAFPNSSAAVKAAMQDNVVEVRGRGGGGFRGGGGMRGGGMRGGHFAGGGRVGGGARYAGGGRYAGGAYYGRRGAYWGAAALGAAAGAAAYGAYGPYGPYYNSSQCGYYPYPACPY
jgi:hypothetical protein